MKAAVCHEFGTGLRIEEARLREPRDDEVLVDIHACAICHSDISYMDGYWGGALPAIYGHEAAGLVVATGPSVRDCKTGDPVLVTLIRSCSSCLSCAAGSPATCETPYDRLEQSPLTDMKGRKIEQGLATAAFAEQVLVHKSQVQQIDNDIPMDSACLLSCGVITGFGAVANTSEMRPGADVAVVGAGGVGLNSIQGARICGASRIIAVDLDQSRLDQAVEFGATHTVLAGDKMHRNIRALTEGRGVDYAYITVGLTTAYEQAPKYIAPMGEIIVVGMPPLGEKAHWTPVNLAFMGQRIKGSSMGSTVLERDVPYLCELYRQKRLKLDELVSGRFALEDINEAIAEVRAGAARRHVISMKPDA